MLVHWSASPSGPFASGVDVNIRGATAVVESHPAHEVGVVLLDGVDCPRDEARVGERDATIAVAVDRDIRRVAVLVAAVARGALDAPVVQRRAEAGVDVEL